MKAEQFIVQSYEGGPERRFYNKVPYLMRADIALSEDPEYEGLSVIHRGIVRGTAMCIIAARAEGLAEVLKTPRKITVDSCLEFAERYLVSTESDAEIPSEEGVVENPTGTPAGA